MENNSKINKFTQYFFCLVSGFLFLIKEYSFIMYSKMDPIKRDGKISEQIEIENRVRIAYPKKWGSLVLNEVTDTYSPAKMEKRLKKELKIENEQLFRNEYTGHGESFFVSKDMYNSMMKCRCGRNRTNAHVLKCVRKARNEYLSDEESEKVDDEMKDESTSKIKNKYPPVPRVSSGMYGWPNNRFAKWEKMTSYVPPATIGPRIRDRPYKSIFLG